MRPILVWRNGNWVHMHHKDFFINMLQSHLKTVQENKEMVELATLSQLEANQVVKINGHQFRYKHES